MRAMRRSSSTSPLPSRRTSPPPPMAGNSSRTCGPGAGERSPTPAGASGISRRPRRLSRRPSRASAGGRRIPWSRRPSSTCKPPCSGPSSVATSRSGFPAGRSRSSGDGADPGHGQSARQSFAGAPGARRSGPVRRGPHPVAAIDRYIPRAAPGTLCREQPGHRPGRQRAVRWKPGRCSCKPALSTPGFRRWRTTICWVEGDRGRRTGPPGRSRSRPCAGPTKGSSPHRCPSWQSSSRAIWPLFGLAHESPSSTIRRSGRPRKERNAAWSGFSSMSRACAKCRATARPQAPPAGGRREPSARPLAGRPRAPAGRCWSASGSEAPALFGSLVALAPGQQLLLLKNSQRFRTWGLFELLIERGKEETFTDPRHAEQLLHLALRIADDLSPASYGRELIEDLRARAWGFIANARRCRRELAASEEAFREAFSRLRRGTEDPLEQALLFDLQASLRRYQERMEESLQLSRRAISTFRKLGQTQAVGKALVTSSIAHAKTEDLSRSIQDLYLALSLIDVLREPRLSAFRLEQLGHGPQRCQAVSGGSGECSNGPDALLYAVSRD